MVVFASAKTDTGCVRERNEDAFLVDGQHALFVVADGMGGHAGGQRASQLAVATLKEYMQAGAGEAAQWSPPKDDEESPPLAQFLADGIRTACAAIYDEAEADESLTGMGTTATALLLRHGWAYIAHVGDSRCYMQRQGRIFQLTEDHSLVNEQVRAGILTKEMARTSRMKNIITRSVGFERDVDVDTFLLPLEAGDKFLLCSDGLSNLVSEEEINAAMEQARGNALVAQLVALALARGGDDNVTVVAAEVTELAETGASQSTGEAPRVILTDALVEPLPNAIPPAAQTSDWVQQTPPLAGDTAAPQTGQSEAQPADGSAAAATPPRSDRPGSRGDGDGGAGGA